MQFLVEAIPQVRRIAVLWEAALAEAQVKATERAMHSVKLKLQSRPFQSPKDFDSAFAAARNEQAHALIILSSPTGFTHIKDLADLALHHRLAAMSVFPQFVDAGGLMAYGPNLPDMFRRAARYVDQIVKGARPAELPIQRPAVFNLSLKVRTAKALGVNLPPSLLLRADQVVE